MIEINNLTKVRVDERFLKKAVQKILKGERQNKTELSIALVSSGEIQKLNKRYRKKNYPTDVLSYIYGKNYGEIILCPYIIERNAKKFGVSFQKELTKVLIHGILHILGYDHEKTRKEAIKMLKKQEKYLKSFKSYNFNL